MIAPMVSGKSCMVLRIARRAPLVGAGGLILPGPGTHVHSPGHHGGMWPRDPDDLRLRQLALASAAPPPWRPGPQPVRVGGCWVCFPRGASGPGATGDPAWAAAVVLAGGRVAESATRE